MWDSRDPWDNTRSEADLWFEDYFRGEDAILKLAGIDIMEDS